MNPAKERPGRSPCSRAQLLSCEDSALLWSAVRSSPFAHSQCAFFCTYSLFLLLLRFKIFFAPNTGTRSFFPSSYYYSTSSFCNSSGVSYIYTSQRESLCPSCVNFFLIRSSTFVSCCFFIFTFSLQSS